MIYFQKPPIFRALPDEFYRFNPQPLCRVDKRSASTLLRRLMPDCGGGCASLIHPPLDPICKVENRKFLDRFVQDFPDNGLTRPSRNQKDLNVHRPLDASANGNACWERCSLGRLFPEGSQRAALESCAPRGQHHEIFFIFLFNIYKS